MLKPLLKYVNAELLITLLVFCIGYLFFDFVSDDYSSFGFNCGAGQFSDFHYFEYYYLGLIGLSEVYRFLYDISDTYNWMGLSWVLFGVMNLYLSLRFLKKVVFVDHLNLYVATGVQILFSILFLENIFALSHTRFSLVFSGLGLLNLVFRKHIKGYETFLYSFLFVLGMLARPESGICMLILVGGAYLIYRIDIPFVVKRLSIPALSTVILLSVIAYDWNHTDEFVKKMEPEIEYNFMERKVVDISAMKTPQDSIKYELAVRGMWIDPEVISPEFMRTIIKPGRNFSLDHVQMAVMHLLKLYQTYIAIPVVMFCLVLLALFSGNKIKALKILLLGLFLFALLFMVDYKGLLLAGRHFLSIQLVGLLVAFFYFFQRSFFPLTTKLKRSILFSVIVTGYSIFITIRHHNDYNHSLLFITQCMEAGMQKVEQLHKNRVVVVTNESRYWFDRYFSLKNKNYTGNTYILFDHGTYSMVPRYSAYMQRLTGHSMYEPEKIIKWFTDNNAIYMADPERFELTKKYFKIIYGMDIEFESPVNINQASHTTNYTTKDIEMRSIKWKK